MTTGYYRDEDEAVVSSVIVALLDLLHRDRSGDQDGPNWCAWANGNSPYELALEAIKEKFEIDFEIEWKEPEGHARKDGTVCEGSRVESVKILRRREHCCPTCGQEL